ncbi:hypothetical protein EN873_24950 [bacterium M00.F.Ca.ET.230.01.1.1]|nr:hypothetical protein EN873_24950 [bacterium M00.F.Ca.ET.230.01.1.1]
MNIRTAQIIARVSNPALREAATACLDLAEKFGQRAAAIKADPSFTEVGRQKTIRDEAAKTYLPGLKAAFAPIAKALADSKMARAALSASVFPQPDPTNIAAALERQEIRALVRGMKPAERMAFIGASRDERIADAVFSAPPALSGLLDEQFGQLRDLVMNRRVKEGQVAGIQEAEEAAEAAQAAMLIARNDIKALVGLNDRAFEKFESKAVPTPWLMKTRQVGTRLPNGDFIGSASGNDSREYVAVFAPGPSGNNIREATADEIALGKYYTNYEQYVADNPGIQITQPAVAA